MTFQPLDPKNHPLPWLRPQRSGAGLEEERPSNGFHPGSEESNEDVPPEQALSEAVNPDDAAEEAPASEDAPLTPIEDTEESLVPAPEAQVDQSSSVETADDFVLPPSALPYEDLANEEPTGDSGTAEVDAVKEPGPVPILPPSALPYEPVASEDQRGEDATAELDMNTIASSSRLAELEQEIAADEAMGATSPDDRPSEDTASTTELEEAVPTDDETPSPTRQSTFEDLETPEDSEPPSPVANEPAEGTAVAETEVTDAAPDIDESPPPIAPAAASTSSRLRLSEILREAERQRGPTATVPVFDQAPAEQPRPPAARPSVLAQDEYPSLLVRPRDRTEPFLDMMPQAMADDVDQRFKDLEKLPAASDPLTNMGPADYVAPPPARERRFQADSAGQVPWKILAVILFAVSLAAFIFSLTGWIVTSEDEATEVNRRIAAELTEVDLYVANNEEAIGTAEPGADGRIALPNFPLPVTLSEEEASGLEAAELRDVILDRSAALTYDQGVEAYGSEAGLFDDLSTPGLVRFGIEVMQRGVHDRLLFLTVVLAVVTAALGGLIVLATRRAGRITTFGVAVAAGGLISLLGSLAMRILFDRATSGQDGDLLADGLGDIAADVSMLFLRNSVVFIVVGVAIVGIGVALTYFDRRRGDELDQIEREQPTLVSG